MKRLILALITATIILTSPATAQCSVDRYEEEGFLIYTTTPEFLIEVDVSSRKPQQVLAAATHVSYVLDTGLVGTTLHLKTSPWNSPDLIPRSSLFTFADGSTLRLDASDLEVERKGRVVVYIGIFRLELEEIDKLFEPVSSVTLIDHRTGREITVEPYPGLFKEQLECAYARWDAENPEEDLGQSGTAHPIGTPDTRQGG
jgi:hypothetical protein